MTQAKASAEIPWSRPTVPQQPRTPWELFLSEMIGTGLLLLGGLSLVIFMFGAGSPIAELLPSSTMRMVLSGFLFGSIGALIAVSPVGDVSGAHINPAVSLGFLLMGKFKPRVAFGYVVAQLTGALLGSLPLLAWGKMGRSIDFGASLPGQGYSAWTVLLGEVATTFGLIASLCVFLATRQLRRFTPAMIPFLYAIMVPLEASISGTSTNPARSFGPAIVSGNFDGWWIYWVGPFLGTVAAIFACSFLASRIEVAKVYHFDSDRSGVFRMMSRSAARQG
ncbi:MAG TPA: aquaporin [Terriglobales bacterium]|nr:aquaporin [Terriglobales bacterium]